MLWDAGVGDAYGARCGKCSLERYCFAWSAGVAALYAQRIIYVDHLAIPRSRVVAAVISANRLDASSMVIRKASAIGCRPPRLVAETHTFTQRIGGANKGEPVARDVETLIIPLSAKRECPDRPRCVR